MHADWAVSKRENDQGEESEFIQQFGTLFVLIALYKRYIFYIT